MTFQARSCRSVSHSGGAKPAELEAAQLGASFDRETCRWSILGDAAEVQRSDTRKSILAALATADNRRTKRPTAVLF
jgi:hypothetical protein